MKNFFLHIILWGVRLITALFGLFTLLMIGETIARWSEWGVGEKFLTALLLVAFVFLVGVSTTLAERIPSKKKAMTGIEFEHYCAKLLLRKGFRDATVTPPSGDYGADIVAHDSKGRLWVFQCKCFSERVSNSAVQEVAAAKAHYKADRAGVMTNSKLTRQARELAVENDVVLYESLNI